MEAYLTQLLTIQKQVNGLVEEIQANLLREKIGSGPPVEMPKRRGRPPKAAASAEPTVAEPAEVAAPAEKPKRVLSDEHKQKLREGRERAKAARDAEKAAASLVVLDSETGTVVDPTTGTTNYLRYDEESGVIVKEPVPPAPEYIPSNAPSFTTKNSSAPSAPPVEEAAPVSSSSSVISEEAEKPKKRFTLRKQPAKVSVPTTEEKPVEELEKPTEEDIYKYMFALQESGACNMLGSGTYLRKRFQGMTSKEAEDIVLNYMSNYEDLYAKYGPNE